MIALIVYPIIMGTIERSKKASFARSIDGLMESTRIDYSEDDFVAPREYFYEKRDLTLLTVNEKTRDEDVKISGKIDGSGFIYIDDDGNISVDICTDDYYAKGPEDDVVITDNPDGTCKTIGKEDPVISLIGDSIIYLNLGEEYKELGAKARTKVGQKLEYRAEIKKNNEIVGSMDTSREGTYEVVYSATNNDKTVSVTRAVIVLDMTPIITMIEPNTNYVRSQDILVSVTATKPNHISEFTYEVLKDGTSMKKETVSGLSKSLSFTETGIYEVIVSVTDNNDHSNRVTKTYKIDHTGPVIVFDPETVELESEDVDGYDLRTGVTVTDNVDGVIENNKVRTSGTLAKAPGSYTITYSVSDNLGNESTKERTFVVKDLTKPEITFAPNEQSTFVKSKTITITATDNIKVNSISYVLIKDNVRGSVTPINNGGTVTVNSTGNYQIEVTAVDSSNNTGTKTSGVYKIDTTAPSIAFSNVQLKITEVNGYDLMTGVTTSDNSGVISRVDKSGALSATLGTQTITYTVYDQAGNSTSKTRTFTIVEADGPILALSNEGSNSWTKAQAITATATDNSNLKTFTYEVFKNNVSQGVKNGTINGKSGSVNIPLNADGTYTIKLTASDQYNNGNTKTSTSVYKIDVTAPTAPTTMNFVYGNWSAYPNNTWTNQDVYVARAQASPGPTGSTDGTSGVAKYQMSLDNVNWFDYAYTATGNYLLSSNGTHTRYFRAVDYAGNASSSISRVAKVDKVAPSYSVSVSGGTSWTTSKTITVNSVSDNGGSGLHSSAYSFDNGSTWQSGNTKTVTVAGTYYVKVRDVLGNISSAQNAVVSNIDTTTPTITRKVASITKNRGESYAVTNLYTVTYGGMGGSTTCKVGTTTVNNLNTLSAGTHTLRCTATGNNGKTSYTDISVTIQALTIDQTILANTPGIATSDPGKNKRYVGASPNNYVWFNNELWRIIGIFNGEAKIIRNNPYPNNTTVWNISHSSPMWEYASLKETLNGEFLNQFDATSKNYIDLQYSWVKFTSPLQTNWNDLLFTREGWYNSERFNGWLIESAQSHWKGAIALPYASDYGYATSSTSSCINNYLTVSYHTQNADCISNNWMSTYKSMWLLNTWVYEGYVSGKDRNGVASLLSDFISVAAADFADGIYAYPTLYLKMTVKITGGTGTSSNPYTLGM